MPEDQETLIDVLEQGPLQVDRRKIRGEIDELTRNMRLGIFMLGFVVRAEGMCLGFQNGADARLRLPRLAHDSKEGSGGI